MYLPKQTKGSVPMRRLNRPNSFFVCLCFGGFFDCLMKWQLEVRGLAQFSRFRCTLALFTLRGIRCLTSVSPVSGSGSSFEFLSFIFFISAYIWFSHLGPSLREPSLQILLKDQPFSYLSTLRNVMY